MSIESEILRIQHNVANAYAAVSEKGGEVPLQPTSSNLAAAVESIPSGGSGGEVYSTEEQRIGTWIDGKPLYRCVFLVTSPASSGDTAILALDPTIEVKKIDGMLYTSEDDASISPVNFSHSDGASIACWFKQSSHVINMRVGVEVQTKRPVELYLEYTKTTDTAAVSLSAQPNAAIQLTNSALDLSSIPSAPVTAAAAGIEIARMEEV